MACGLKKQNTQGGVHLTERTCSPYNPIIKLMVDDCLGLPIYPVASVDSVIDEEGKTLRQLLAELQIETQDGKISLETIDLIIERIANLEDNTEDLLNLKRLVNAISRLSDLDGTGSVITIDNVPIIVDEIQKIQRQLGNEGNISSRLGNLETLTGKLKALLVAIANLTQENVTEYGITELDDDEDNNHIISIVFKVLDLLDRVEELETAIGVTPGEGSLSSRVSALEENKSDRDDVLLNLNVHQLSRNEYPITGAYFYLPNSRDAVGNYGLGMVRYETPYYFAQGEVHNPSLRDWYDFMPFNSGRTESGWQVFTLNQSTSEYEPLKINGNNVYTGGDGKLGLAEVEFIIDAIIDTSHEIQTYGKLYRKTEDGDYCELGNVNNDGETNVADINAYINALLSNTSSSLNSLNALLGFDLTTEVFGWIYNAARTHTELSITSRKQFLTSYIFIFHDEQNSKGIFVEDALITVEIYPLISNKLYLNLANNKVYSYIKGEMLPTSGSVEINLQRAMTELDGLIDIILETIGELDDEIEDLLFDITTIDGSIEDINDALNVEKVKSNFPELDPITIIEQKTYTDGRTNLEVAANEYTIEQPVRRYVNASTAAQFVEGQIYLVTEPFIFYKYMYQVPNNVTLQGSYDAEEMSQLSQCTVEEVASLITVILGSFFEDKYGADVAPKAAFKITQRAILNTILSVCDPIYSYDDHLQITDGVVSFSAPFGSDGQNAALVQQLYTKLIGILYAPNVELNATRPDFISSRDFVRRNPSFGEIITGRKVRANNFENLSKIVVFLKTGTTYEPIPITNLESDIANRLIQLIFDINGSQSVDMEDLSELIQIVLTPTGNASQNIFTGDVEISLANPTLYYKNSGDIDDSFSLNDHITLLQLAGNNGNDVVGRIFYDQDNNEPVILGEVQARLLIPKVDCTIMDGMLITRVNGLVSGVLNLKHQINKWIDDKLIEHNLISS